MTKFTAYGFVFITIVFTIFGQLVIKWQASMAGVPPEDWRGRAQFLYAIAINPWIVCGLFSAVIAAVAWILAMTKLPINVAYPLVALTFPCVVVLSHVLFGEELTLLRLIGIALIVVGVSIVNL